MNVTLILGSIRVGRETHKPALFLKERLETAGHVVTYLDLQELALPLFDDSPEHMASPSARRLIESILAAQAVIYVTPEYNHDMGSATKNSLDYLRHRELLHKPVGLVTSSSGLVGGARATLIARGTMPTLGAVIVPTTVLIPNVQDVFLDEKTCDNPKIVASMDKMIKELTAYAARLDGIADELA